MIHSDHVNLLRPARLQPGGVWADFGAGSGAFTLALRELVGSGSQIYAIDKDRGSLRQLQDAYQARFGDLTNLHLLTADFSHALALPPLDGALMANSLHYLRNKDRVLLHVRSFLKPAGSLLLVEYNVDSGNPWVPYPLSFDTWRALVPPIGFTEPQLLATHPSSFLREFYSALARRQEP
jgi:ubiquinone/menaquinone biosynthesis C-methylase UbiE